MYHYHSCHNTTFFTLHFSNKMQFKLCPRALEGFIELFHLGGVFVTHLKCRPQSLSRRTCWLPWCCTALPLSSSLSLALSQESSAAHGGNKAPQPPRACHSPAHTTHAPPTSRLPTKRRQLIFDPTINKYTTASTWILIPKAFLNMKRISFILFTLYI